MKVINARNVHQALPLGMRYLQECGIPSSSRVGDVIVAPGPVTTVYERPQERVLFWPERDANPWLHFFDGLWVLAGRQDVALLARFAKRMLDYSDNGITLHGAYGRRLRKHFSITERYTGDQLEAAVLELREDPLSRRVVLTMWDPEDDLGRHGKDLPCNTQIYVGVSLGKRDEPNRLNITVCCRSNDILWGAYGANAVQFSMIQEYLAARLGLAIGTYYQMSNNYHAYSAIFEKTHRGNLRLWNPTWNTSPYDDGSVTPSPLVDHPDSWDEECQRFLDNPEQPNPPPYRNRLFSNTARSLWFAHVAYKAGDLRQATEIAAAIKARDWRRAATEWLQRRTAAREEQQA